MPAVGGRPEVVCRGKGKRREEGEEEMISDAARRMASRPRYEGPTLLLDATRRQAGRSHPPPIGRPLLRSSRPTNQAPASTDACGYHALFRSPGTSPPRPLAPCRGDNILTLSSYNTYAITQYYAMRYNCTRTLLKCIDVNESVRNPRVQVQCDRSSPNIHGNNNKSPPLPTSHPPHASLHIQHRKRLHRAPVSPCLRRAR